MIILGGVCSTDILMVSVPKHRGQEMGIANDVICTEESEDFSLGFMDADGFGFFRVAFPDDEDLVAVSGQSLSLKRCEEFT